VAAHAPCIATLVVNPFGEKDEVEYCGARKRLAMAAAKSNAGIAWQHLRKRVVYFGIMIASVSFAFLVVSLAISSLAFPSSLLVTAVLLTGLRASLRLIGQITGPTSSMEPQ
jgi:hypothetical protein